MITIKKQYNGLEIWTPNIKEEWQFPVITEKQALISLLYIKNNLNNYVYVAIPWASLIDKNELNLVDNAKFINSFLKQINNNKIYITVCQHIHFKRIIPILKKIGINVCFTPHKIINENVINTINIEPYPLYAVNVEDNTRNRITKNKVERKYLYSFIGNYTNQYLTKIRQNIFSMKHPEDTFIKNTDTWHFNKIVYDTQVRGNELTLVDKNNMNSTCDFYNNILIQSRYSLCPSGTGPNSIRFWESLAVGSIPVLLADTLQLPFIDKSFPIQWNDAIIIIKESLYQKIPIILNNISYDKEQELRENCIKLYDYFSKLNFSKTIIETLNIKTFKKNIINSIKPLNNSIKSIKIVPKNVKSQYTQILNAPVNKVKSIIVKSVNRQIVDKYKYIHPTSNTQILNIPNNKDKGIIVKSVNKVIVEEYKYIQPTVNTQIKKKITKIPINKNVLPTKTILNKSVKISINNTNIVNTQNTKQNTKPNNIQVILKAPVKISSIKINTNNIVERDHITHLKNNKNNQINKFNYIKYIK